MRLKDRIVLLTDGMTEYGRALTQRFSQEGACVIVCVDAACSPIGTKDNTAYFQCDPTDETQVRALVDEAVRRYGRLDVLVSNIAEVEKMTLEDADDERMRRALSRNAASAFFFTQAAARHMRRQQSGKILYLGSIHSEKPVGSAIGFSLAMGAVEMLCREVALDMAGYSVQTVFVQMGAMQGDERRFESMVTPLYDHVKDKTPGGELVKWREIEDLLVYLASSECTAFNGATLRADHGFLLHYMPHDTYERQGVDADD